MRYVSEDQATQMMGIGYLGEVRQGQDGNLYQYMQGVDGLGNPIGGFWSKFKRGHKFLHKVVTKVAPFIPGPYGAAIRAGVKFATPLLQKAGVAGNEGIGALYEAPDGSLYQVQGLEADEELQGMGDDAMTQMMGVGYLGEVRQGPDGNLYQYMQGVDGLGNPLGAWWKRLVRRALPLARQFAPFVPGGAAALTAATPFLKQAGIEGYEGLDEEEELRGLDEDEELRGFAEDDELRGLDEDEELRGLDEDEELRGFAEDDELRGLAEDDELRGLDEDEELRGLNADDELQGLAEDEDLRGVAEDQEMQGMDGYVRQGGMSGLEAYVPQDSPQTRWHVAPAQAAEVWKPLW